MGYTPLYVPRGIGIRQKKWRAKNFGAVLGRSPAKPSVAFARRLVRLEEGAAALLGLLERFDRQAMQ